MDQAHPSPYATGKQDAAVDTPTQDAGPASPPQPAPHHGHGWTMGLMCLPMVLIVGYLLVTGAVGGGALVYALGCVVMMGVMMLLMNRSSGGGRGTSA